MTEVVTVTGTPTLSLNDGGTATYTGGSGTGALTFSYTVAGTDSDCLGVGDYSSEPAEWRNHTGIQAATPPIILKQV